MSRSERTARSVLALSAPRAVTAPASSGVRSGRPAPCRHRAAQALHTHCHLPESRKHGPEIDSR